MKIIRRTVEGAYEFIDVSEEILKKERRTSTNFFIPAVMFLSHLTTGVLVPICSHDIAIIF